MGKFNSPQEFIIALVPGAQKGYSKYGIFASVTIAQALGEAGWEMSQPSAYKDNNLFGIKTAGAHDASLDIGGGSYPSDGTGGQYCKYASVADGVEDHGYFLKHNPRYEEAGVFSAKTPEEQCDAIAKAGYATSGGYTDLLKQLINQYNLKQYDTGSYTGDSGSGSKSSSASTDSNPLISWDENYKPKVWETDLSRVTKTSKHKKMSYFGADVQQPTISDVNKINKMTDKYAETRHFDKAPPGYYDYSTYDHRRLAYQLADETAQIPLVNGQYDVSSLVGGTALTGDSSGVTYETGDMNRLFRLGDCYFVIPPEFINTTTKTTADSIQGVRQSGSMHIKNGYSRKEIQANLLMNGMNQINGYEVESPFSKSYYVDGLRNLISQFKYTPFLPIENPVINIIHGVDNVALRNINVETIPGFPEALQVSVSMQEFNASPYTRTPNDMFGDCIDWDLFRYYTQKPLIDDKFPEKLEGIKTGNLTAKFSFSILTQTALDKAYKTEDDNNNGTPDSVEYKNHSNSIDDYNLYVNVYDEDNYEEWISDSDNLEMTHLSFSMGNIMPIIQLSNHESPTMQYLGATDTEFTFGFETTDEGVAAKFNAMNKENQDLVRTNRFKNGIGFLKIENELVQLTGTKFLLMNDVNVSTVPGFPGLYSITVTATSYDSAQKETEKLIGMRPFKDNRKGTRNDLISMLPNGIANKIQQDVTIMERFEELELYPDLHLPTYKEVDDAIVQIKKYRAKHNFQENMLFDKYPRHSCVIPGSVKERQYEGFVDPDFYMMNVMTTGNAQASGQQNEEVAKLYNVDGKTKYATVQNATTLNKAIYGVSDSTLPGTINSVADISKAFSSINNPSDMFQLPKLKPDAVKEPKYAYGYEGIQGNVHKGLLNTVKNSPTGTQPAEESGGAQAGGPGGTSATGAGADPVTVEKKTGIAFVDLCCDRANAGCGYVWGSDGQMCTQSLIDSLSGTHGRDHYIKEGKYDARKWIGKQVFDCSGLVCWALSKCGMNPLGRVDAASLGGLGSSVSMNSLQVGDVLYSSTHTAIYIGNNQTVEAAGTAEGVVYKTAEGRFSNAVRIPDLQSKNSAYIAAHPEIYSGGSSKVDYSNASYAKAVATSNAAAAGDMVLADFGNGNQCDQWNDKIKKHAANYNLDPNMVKAFMMIESSGNPNEATGAAKGLMQINTAVHSISNPFDPDENLEAGCKELYECGSKLGFDKEKTITGYNAGMGYYEAVYVKKTKSLPNETKNYFTKYDNFYGQLLANGAKPGNTNTLTNGGAPLKAASGGSTNAEAQPYNYNKYGYQTSDFENPNAGKVHGDKISNIDINKFGHAFVDKIATIGSNKTFSFDVSAISRNIKSKNDPQHIIEYMFVDQIQYSMKGTLCRAFPSYLFVIIDEMSDYVDRKKLWSNYYVSRSVIDVNIHEAYDSPINTATVTLSNFYSNLTHLKVNKAFESYAFDDDEWFKRWAYRTTGTVLDEEITDKMIEFKNELYDDIYLEEGARIHIRLGYGSDPARYPTSFNGSVVQVDNGETVTIVAQSDGSELVNMPITDKTTDTNKDLGLDEEVSDIISNMLTARKSNFWYAFSSGFFDYKSRYGIEHYGIHQNMAGADLGPGTILENTFDYLTNPIGSVFEAYDNAQNYQQYDIIKNIYKGTYEGTPYCLYPYNPFDGEYNIRFFCNGKTVWDVTKMCEKAVPDFIAYPRYFGFEQRLFYGLPAWLCRYNYNMDGSAVYEESKSFAQAHNISSLDSIINNNIKIDTRGLATNMIGIYTLGGDLASTPVVMSDKNIDWSKQKTRTIDTTSVQDFGWIPSIVDKLLSWTGAFDNGKQLAIMCCVSELMNSWKETYSGNILILGQPEIRPYDYIYLNDDFLHMNGMFTVREVVHSLSVGTGLTSNIVPGLIANNTLKQSGMTNVLASTATVLKWTANILSLANAGIIQWSRGASGIKFLKLTEYAKKNASVTKNFINGKGKLGYSFIKDFKIVTKGADFAKEVKTLATGLKDIKAIASVLEVGEGIMTAASIAFPPAIIATIAIDIVINIGLTWLYDLFAYDNTICLNPLYTTSPSGQVNAFVGNRTGQKTLLPGYSGNQESS